MTRKFTTYCAAVLGIVIATSVAQANLLDDGNFTAATNSSVTSNSAWTLTVNFPDLSNPAAQYQTGFANAQNTSVGGSEAPGSGNGVWFRSFEGNQGGSGEPLAQATLEQSVAVTTSGTYALSFAAGIEEHFTADELFVSITSSGTGGSASVDLLTATIPFGNIGGAASINPGGTPFLLNLFGVTAGDTLTVQARMINGADSQIPGGQSAFLDTFSLVHTSAVPEPSSMGLLALGGICLIRRRRSSRTRH